MNLEDIETIDDWDIFGGKFPVFQLESRTHENEYQRTKFILVDDQLYLLNNLDCLLYEKMENYFPPFQEVKMNKKTKLSVCRVGKKPKIIEIYNILDLYINNRILFVSKSWIIMNKIKEFYAEQNWIMSESNSIIGYCCPLNTK